MYSHQSFYLWCKSAVWRIHYKPDRIAVEQELHEHVEERYKDFIACGYSADDAVKKTLEAMGSPQEVAKLLAKLYNPVWPYMLKLSRGLLFSLLLFTMFALPNFIKANTLHSERTTSNYSYLSLNYNPYTESFYVGNNESAIKLQTVAPEFSGSISQFSTDVTDVVLWKHAYASLSKNVEYDLLCIRMEISHPTLMFLGTDTDTYDHIWAEDSAGNYYYSSAESLYAGEWETDAIGPHVVGNCQNAGWGKYVMELALVGYQSYDAKWIELHYDRDGRNYTLRLYLSKEDGA